MTCKRTDLGGGFTSWSCTRGQQERPKLCVACQSRPRQLECKFELRGSKAGQLCNRPICAHCADTVGGVPLCPAHVKFLANEATRQGGR